MINEHLTSLLPERIKAYTNNKKILFLAKAPHLSTFFRTLPILIFGIIWTCVILGMAASSDIKIQNIKGAIANKDPEIIFAGVFILFLLVGAGMIAFSIRSLIADGHWFLGTENELVEFGKNTEISKTWNDYTGEIYLSGNNDKAVLMIYLPTETIRINNRSRTVRHFTFMPNISGAEDIERICKEQIEKAKK